MANFGNILNLFNYIQKRRSVENGKHVAEVVGSLGHSDK